MHCKLLLCGLLAALACAGMMASVTAVKVIKERPSPSPKLRSSSCISPSSLICKINFETYELNGSPKCRPCRRGSYIPTLGDCCMPCNGIVRVSTTDNQESATCLPCPGPGAVPWRVPTTQTTICVCQPGYQATGQTNGVITGCEKCAAGKANPIRTTSPTACTACTDNTVAPTAGMARCVECKRNSVASGDRTSCGCPENFYVNSPRGRVPNKERASVVGTVDNTNKGPGSNSGVGDGGSNENKGPGSNSGVGDGGSNENKGPGSNLGGGNEGFLNISCKSCGGGTWTNPPGNTWGGCCLTGTSWDPSSRTCT